MDRRGTGPRRETRKELKIKVLTLDYFSVPLCLCGFLLNALLRALRVLRNKNTLSRERLRQESRDVPRVHVLVGALAEGVVPARQRLDGSVEPTAQEFARRLAGEFRQEREVVAAIDHQRLFRPTLKLVEVHDRTDRQPDLAQLVLGQHVLDALPLSLIHI